MYSSKQTHITTSGGEVDDDRDPISDYLAFSTDSEDEGKCDGPSPLTMWTRRVLQKNLESTNASYTKTSLRAPAFETFNEDSSNSNLSTGTTFSANQKVIVRNRHLPSTSSSQGRLQDLIQEMRSMQMSSIDIRSYETHRTSQSTHTLETSSSHRTYSGFRTPPPNRKDHPRTHTRRNTSSSESPRSTPRTRQTGPHTSTGNSITSSRSSANTRTPNPVSMGRESLSESVPRPRSRSPASMRRSSSTQPDTRNSRTSEEVIVGNNDRAFQRQVYTPLRSTTGRASKGQFVGHTSDFSEDEGRLPASIMTNVEGIKREIHTNKGIKKSQSIDRSTISSRSRGGGLEREGITKIKTKTKTKAC